jgi:DNA-binding NtrC family response regulator
MTVPVILMLDDDAAERALIEDAIGSVEYRLIVAKDLDEFRLQMAQQSVDLAIVSLTAIREHDIENLQIALQDAPETKVLVLAPAPHGNGLSTLLQAESLHANHLLAKPINPRQLASILTSAFPQPSSQE